MSSLVKLPLLLCKQLQPLVQTFDSNVDAKQCSPEIISIPGVMALTVTQQVKLGRGMFFLSNNAMQSDLTHANVVPLQLSRLQWRSS